MFPKFSSSNTSTPVSSSLSNQSSTIVSTFSSGVLKVNQISTSDSNVKSTASLSVTESAVPIPTRPMGIPIKTKASQRHGFDTLQNNNRTGRRSSSARAHRPHKGVPPAVAALLSVTSIPPPKKSNLGPSKLDYSQVKVEVKVETEEDVLDTVLEADFERNSEVDEDGYNDLFGDDDCFLEPLSPTLSVRTASFSALSVLLSPPDDEFSELSRSQSLDSVPSLVNDSDSSSSWDSPPTHSPKASNLRRKAIERRARIITSPTEECHEHPLLSSSLDDGEYSPLAERNMNIDNNVDNNTTSRPEPPKQKSSFKSNLTASLRVLKSAAKTFTSMSVQFVQPDEFFTRSIMNLNPQFRDERRPAVTNGEVDPALRRYLNRNPPDRCTGAIQMQTYKRTVRRIRTGEKGKKAPPSEAMQGPPRQREIRENSDFLRVIVLEMNMRRVGKLSDTANGKARLILPPRQIPKNVRPLGDATFWEAWSP